MASNLLLCFCLVLGVAISQTTVQPFESPPTSVLLHSASPPQIDESSLRTSLDEVPAEHSFGRSPFAATSTAPVAHNYTVLRFTREPQSRVVKNGASVELHCAVDGVGVAFAIQWLYAGNSLKTGRRKFVRQSDGTLVITKAKRNRSDEGTYQCKVLSDGGVMLSRPAQLTIAMISRQFSESPANVTTSAGGTALLHCTIRSVPPANITWQHNGRPLSVAGSDRHSTDAAGMLSVRRLTVQDGGQYSCVASNDMVGRQRVSEPAFVTVTPAEGTRAPVMLTRPSAEPVAVLANSSLVLPCVADGSPPPIVGWTTLSAGDSPPTSVVTDGGSLMFSSIQLDDSGTYLCTATNSVGQVTQEVNVTVLMRPVLTSTLEPLLQRQTGQLVRKECKAVGYPTPTITWLKDGRRITWEGGRVSSRAGSLLIRNLQSTDAGIYQCVVYNAAGYVATEMRLVTAVDNPVVPPSNLRVLSTTSQSASLAWDVADPANYLAYTLHFKKAVHGGTEHEQVSRGTTWVLDQLDPYTNYTVYVRGYTSVKASDPSEPITLLTAQDVPSQAPSVTLVAVSPTALNVSWEPLPPEVSNGIVTGYRIISQRANDPSTASMVQVDASRRSFLIEDLVPGRAYDVRVLAATQAGYPNVTRGNGDWVLQKMPVITSTDEGPRPPTVHLAVRNHSTIMITWTMPEVGAPATGFRVLFRSQEVGGQLEGPIRLPAHVSQYYLTNLASSTFYEVHVRAVAADGQSAESIKTILTPAPEVAVVEPTDMVVVEPPVQLAVQPLNATAVHVTWQYPPSSRTIKYFTVKYRPLRRQGGNATQLSSTNRELTVTGLDSYTYYEFSVRSHDAENNFGPYSEARKIRTQEGAPSAPENVTWAPLDASRILVQWQQPRLPHGLVSGYRVLYSSDRDKPLDQWQELNIPASSGTRAQINQLVPNQKYWLRVRARTAAALGKPSDSVEFQIRAVLKGGGDAKKGPPPDAPTYAVAVVTAVLVVLVGLMVLALLVYRRRRRRRCRSPAVGRSGQSHLNGASATSAVAAAATAAAEDQLEMEPCTPMLTHVPPAANQQLDTKGGHPPPKPANGRANGFVHPLYLSTDRLRHHGSQDQNESRVSLINNNSSLLSQSSEHQPP